MAEAQNTEALQSGKVELKSILKEKRTLEISINTLLSTVIKIKKLIHTQSLENTTSEQEMLITAKQEEQRT